MDSRRIADLLAPFASPLGHEQLATVAAYLDLLLRWNARLNLTAVRDPEQIVTRHFGESLFAASRLLVPAAALGAIDLGSGAGFPGLPLKIYAPAVRLTLIESQHKKIAFLREVVRALHLYAVEVFAGRAEQCPARAELVTLRAVERFDSILPVAASLLAVPGRPQAPAAADPTASTPNSATPSPRLALLIGAAQVDRAHLLSAFHWDDPIAIPQSSARVLLVGRHQARHESEP